MAVNDRELVDAMLRVTRPVPPGRFACRPCSCGGMCDKCRQTPCPSCGVGESGTWDTHFDRSLCACGSMHTYCNECGNAVDECWFTETWNAAGRQTAGDKPKLVAAENEAHTRVVDAPASTTPPPAVCLPCLCDPDTDAVCDRNCP